MIKTKNLEFYVIFSNVVWAEQNYFMSIWVTIFAAKLKKPVILILGEIMTLIFENSWKW